MPRDFTSSLDALVPPQTVPAEADALTWQVSNLIDGHPKHETPLEGMDQLFDRIASRLYSLASMLVGEGEDGERLVESTIATVELGPGASPIEARQSCQRILAAEAIAILERRQPGSLAAPEGLEHSVTCIEDDDLDAAGEYGEELERMLSGPDRGRVREWLESLPAVLRAIFVLRAVAGFGSAETAGLLASNAGPGAAGWTAESVRESFRQGLCSLASQLLHATAGR
jgi:DNA-directed RNA polymerase specialized sigma24 family protein